MNRGVTLPELLCCLFLLGVGGSILLGQARSQADHLAVRAAREEIVALFHHARLEARMRGESRVWIRESAGVLLLVRGGGEGGADADEGAEGQVRSEENGWKVAKHIVPGDRGVALSVAGTRSELEIRFGPRGLARFASATLELERGGRDARLVVSTHGRVRR